MRLPRRFSLSFVVLALLALPASGATLTVLSPASVTPGLKAMAEQYSAKAGKAVTVGGGSRAAVLGALRKGPADMVVLPTSDMIEMNLVHGMTPLGRIPVGVAVKAGAPVPDVSTPEKFLAVLRQARGVAFADPSAGTSAGKAIAGLLGLSDFHGVKRVPVQGLAVTALADGRADIALQLAPELVNDKSVAFAGPVPERYGAAVDFSAGIAAISLDALGARNFISFITNPANRKLWESHGVTPLFH